MQTGNSQRSLRTLTGSTLSGLLALGLFCSTPETASAAGTEALFNGKDLSNWEAVLEKPGVKKEEVWSVRDGMIICKGEPMGYIHTTKPYTNFRLAVEWRWAPGQKPGNSGILMRINGEPKPLPRCLECQLKSGDAGDLYGFHGMQIDGPSDRRRETKGHKLGGDLLGVKKISGNEKPPGEWNKAEIVAQGGELTVSINGQKVNEAIKCEVISGPIGLQSEGGEVHFRNVSLTPLE